jgi:hypothetical protein
MHESRPAAATRRLAPRLSLLLFLVLVLGTGLGPSCGQVFKTIKIDRPAASLLVSDGTLFVAARVAGVFDPATVEARIDGVGVIAALGLVPPVAGGGGTVQIGADTVTVSSFDYDPARAGSAKHLTFVATGLSMGQHQVEVSGLKTADQSLTVRTTDFDVIGPLSLEAQTIASHGLLLGPIPLSTGGELRAVTAGEPLAATPVGLSDGGELRSGFQEAAEAHIAAGTP